MEKAIGQQHAGQVCVADQRPQKQGSHRQYPRPRPRFLVWRRRPPQRRPCPRGARMGRPRAHRGRYRGVQQPTQGHRKGRHAPASVQGA